MAVKNYFVIGGGPVGCYLAYKLLSEEGTRVFLFESRKFERAQVIRIPFAIAKDLPTPVKNSMWCDEETRLRIFTPSGPEDTNYWPIPNYSYWPWISIGCFQKEMVDFLSAAAMPQDRFFFIPDQIDLELDDLPSAIQKVYPEISIPSEQITALFCTCGGFAKTLREQANCMEGKRPESKGHGIYLLYQNDVAEEYQRDGTPMSYTELGARGISYAAANNCQYNVQLYTYPAGELSAVYEHIPESFIQRAKYSGASRAITLGGDGVPSDAVLWFEWYRTVIIAEAKKAGIQLPADLQSVNVFYAERSEYYWNKVAAHIQLQAASHSTPVFFVGDSAGSTDYKFGLSVGRGLLSAQVLVNAMKIDNYDVNQVISDFQSYWNTIIEHEFNKGPLLTKEPWIQFQYLIKGRELLISENEKIGFYSDEDYDTYLDMYQALLPGFVRTSEASAVLFVNTQAVKENIKNILEFGKKLENSKIIGVVKGNGYGLGAELMTEMVIQSGINFVGVAKLQEAVSLRNSAIANSNNVRVVVFEAPLLHDLSTYAANHIEMHLPSSKEGESVQMLEQWVQHSSAPLHVHIMVDTGMRREGGAANNLPESVLRTVEALLRLGEHKVVFAGLATHLACYYCTDYSGDEIIDFRALQLQRFHQVVTHLLTHGVRIPLIHLGGGLGLLAAQWPKQFAGLSKQYGIELYSRVGHGLYGMEFEADLNDESPSMRPTVALDLQVRNVFFVEADEPVSYGGHWRAPSGGTWVATLSGGWAEGVPRTAETLGQSKNGMVVSINGQHYPVVGRINMNAMMINLGASTTVKAGDRAVIFGWRKTDPKLNVLASLSGQISPSIMVNISEAIPRIPVSE